VQVWGGDWNGIARLKSGRGRPLRTNACGKDKSSL